MDFKPYKEEDSISSYKQFIQENPNNKYVKDAKARIDELIYTDYREKGILMGLKKFAKRYPENIYVNEAKNEMDDLELKPPRKAPGEREKFFEKK